VPRKERMMPGRSFRVGRLILDKLLKDS